MLLLLSNVQVIIIGGGFAGPAAALRLKATLGARCTIYELRERPSTLGGAINMTCNGLRLLDQLGIYEKLKDVGSETLEIQYFSANGGNIGTLPLGAASKRKYGYGAMRIVREAIHNAILQRIDEEEISIKYNMRLTQIDESEDYVKVTFADGTVDTCDLLIGADGIHSVVRTMHVQPSFEPEYSGMSSLYALVPTGNIKSPIFFRENMVAVMNQSGFFGLGFCDAKKETMYWFNTKELPARERDGWIAYGSESDRIKAELKDRSKDITFPLIHELLDKSDEIFFYPIYRLPLGGKWFTQRTILLGDAGHGRTLHSSDSSDDTACWARNVNGVGGCFSTISTVETK